jgi:BirA family biotin operon repressor/biotin-[acetyl-CoA-carboxylase] ligase
VNAARVRLGAVGSTNDEARRLIAEGAADGTVVTATEQTAGRGRRGNVWSSPSGNLYLSAILRPTVPASVLGQLGFVAAVALAETLEALLGAGHAIALKWPNDVLVDDRKIAGILLESETTGAAARWVIVGVGVNVAHGPAVARVPATSVAALGVAVIPDALAERLIDALFAWRRVWEHDGFEPVRAAWLARAVGVGAMVRVNLEHDSFEARFAALDDSGALVAELPGGVRRLVAAGEVHVLGAA